MQTVIETKEFIRSAKRINMSEDERIDLISYLSVHPNAGDEISGTGGMRKLRFAANGKGKSGGYRVITFFTGSDIPVFLITVYSKSQKANISDTDKNIFKSLSDIIVKNYKKRNSR